MTPAPDVFPELSEAGEHLLPASFFGDAAPLVRVYVLAGAGDLSVLSPAEQARAASFGSVKRRDEFVRGRTLVRRIASAELACTPPDVALGMAPEGGFLPLEGGMHLSLTHTAGVAALAVAPFPVGLDAERIRPVQPHLAARMLAPGEALPERAEPLLHVWTAKEAVLKATGQGLRAGLRRVRVAWRGAEAGLIHADAGMDGVAFHVSVRRHGDVLWALAWPETGAATGRSGLII